MNMHTILISVCATVLAIVPAPAVSEYSVLAGYFHGTEPTAPILQPGCFNPEPVPNVYRVESITVTQTANYTAVSAQWDIGVDTWFAVYRGSFDPLQPGENLIAQQNLGDWWSYDQPVRNIHLQQGVEYQLVVSPWCVPSSGTWTIVFEGAGEVQSEASISGLDNFQYGTFGNTAEVANIGCEAGEYHLSGPQQVARSSTYYLVDVSLFFGDSVCVGVYTTPFNPAKPNEGRVALLHGYYQPVELNAGQNYYFVATPHEPGQKGDYFFLVLPTGDVYIDPVLSGSWYNPETPGQGFFLDVLGYDNRIFMGWFTYDLERPTQDVSTYLGDTGHRWLTAFGTFRDSRAVMDIEVTTGGVFDQPTPAVGQRIDGQLVVRLFDCQSGEISFDLGSGGRSGEIPIQRASSQAARPCEYLTARAGKPRPLMEQD